MKYRVRLTYKAEQDVSDVLAWFRKRSAVEAGNRLRFLRVAKRCENTLEFQNLHGIRMDTLFDYKMPEWYNRAAFLWRGLCLGFAAGYLLAARLPGFDPTVSAIVVIVITCALAILPSLPKAYIEHRNRVRALRDGSLLDKLKDHDKQ